jgi:hypothetical protein
MFSPDDLFDLCADAITRTPGDPVPQPLFECRPAGDRFMAAQIDGPNAGATGVAQTFEVTGAGKYLVSVIEVLDGD